MEKTTVIRETNFDGIGVPKRGKVRDIYDLDQYLLIVATDRLSAFDVVMEEGIPGKGKILNQLSTMWFRALEDVMPNHLVSTNPAKYPVVCGPYMQELEGRSMLVKKAAPEPVEFVVCGNLTGSIWKEYRDSPVVNGWKNISGYRLEPGMLESWRLMRPILRPSTKASDGQHDEYKDMDWLIQTIGEKMARFYERKSLELYGKAYIIAMRAGIIIADTKFEFGRDENGMPMLIDEVLTPDSSRFWAMNTYMPGESQDSFDKQYVRDYLINVLCWDKKPPVPHLPPVIVEKTSEKYRQAYQRLALVI